MGAFTVHVIGNAEKTTFVGNPGSKKEKPRTKWGGGESRQELGTRGKNKMGVNRLSKKKTKSGVQGGEKERNSFVASYECRLSNRGRVPRGPAEGTNFN